jgi:hypothetical protein
MQSNNPNISISLPQIYRASGTASERPDAERNGLIPDTIRCVPTSVFSTAHAHLQVQPQSPPHQGCVGHARHHWESLDGRETRSGSTGRAISCDACLCLERSISGTKVEDASESRYRPHLRSFSTGYCKSPCVILHGLLTGCLPWSWSLTALAARIGKIRVAQLNAESPDSVSTLETKCFDQRGLDFEDI